MARKATKRKAITRVSPRRGQSARLVEEKHIGLETTDWDSVSDYETAFRDTLRHYGYFYDTKTFYKWTKEWFKKHKKAQAKYITPLEPWRVSATVGSMCRMQMNGAKFEGRWAEWFDGKIQELIDLGKSKLKEKKSEKVITGPNRKSPAELVKDKTSDFIADQEVILDDWENAPSDYSMFSELQKIDAAYVTAKAVAEYYSPVRDEIALLVSKKDKELLEAYENMPVRKHSKLLKFLDAMVTDAEKYMATKKAVRKTRKKRAPSVGAQVAKVQYLKDSAEYKIASVSPVDIVGASEVWLFNTKYRTLSRLETSSRSGFTVKGTTIQDVDLEKSDKKKLRKPEEFFSEVSTTTKAKLNKVYNAIRTKPSKTTGRINTDTIIFKVY
jgi:hypothetical protein